MAEESGSRTHPSTLACSTGFEVRPPHRGANLFHLEACILPECCDQAAEQACMLASACDFQPTPDLLSTEGKKNGTLRDAIEAARYEFRLSCC